MIASARGLLIAIVALTFGVLGLAASAAAVAVPSSAGATFTYDSHHYIVFLACTTTDRGPPPPTTYAHATDPGAVGRRSRSASARQATGTTALIITYDRPALLEHIDNATPTPDRTTPEPDGDLFSLQRSHAAANSAARAVPDPLSVLRPDGSPLRGRKSSPAYVGYRDADGNLQTVGNLDGVHAEVRIQQMQPGASMSRPFGWRTLDSSKGPEWVERTVCSSCQVFPRDLFSPGTRGAQGGPWGE